MSEIDVYDKIESLCIYPNIAKSTDITNATKLARASNPSIKLKAFVKPATAKYVNGSDNTPRYIVLLAKFDIVSILKPPI